MQFFKHQIANDQVNCEAVSVFDAEEQNYQTEYDDNVDYHDTALEFAENTVYDIAWNLEKAVAPEFRTEEMSAFIAAAHARTLKLIIE